MLTLLKWKAETHLQHMIHELDVRHGFESYRGQSLEIISFIFFFVLGGRGRGGRTCSGPVWRLELSQKPTANFFKKSTTKPVQGPTFSRLSSTFSSNLLLDNSISSPVYSTTILNYSEF